MMNEFDLNAIDVGTCAIENNPEARAKICEFKDCLTEGLSALRKLVKSQIIKGIITGLIITVEKLCAEAQKA